MRKLKALLLTLFGAFVLVAEAFTGAHLAPAPAKA